MEGVIGVIVIFGVCFAVVHFYSKFLMSGMASRTIVTSASPAQVRDAFVRKVAGSTWKIVDDGNPMIAQNPLVTGIRQQIGLEVRQEGGAGAGPVSRCCAGPRSTACRTRHTPCACA